jgi:hypothetical protein
MTRADDVPRLEDGADDVMRRAIGAARRDLPGPERMQALSAALSAKLVIPGAAGGAGNAPPVEGASGAGGTGAAGAGAIGGKATGVIATLIVAGGIWYAARSPGEAPPPVTPAAVASVVGAPSPTAHKTERPDPIPTVSVDDLPTLAPSAQPRAKSAPPPAASAPEAAGESDLSLLRRAQGTLGSDPAGALALCGTHERTFPRSPYAQEREVMTIEALIRLGRRSEAESRADAFARAFPKSGHNRRIDSLLGR